MRRGYRWLVNRAFHHFYHEFAWTYNAVAWLVSRGLWFRWVAAVLPLVRGRTLELGCGTGAFQELLTHRHPATAVGLDASPFMLRHTRRRRYPPQRVPLLLRADARRLPCAAQSYTTVVATFPSDYIVHPDTLREVRRVLAPGGQLLIVDAAMFTRAGWYEQLVALAYRIVWLRPPTAPVPAQSPHAPDTVPLAVMHPYLPILERAGFAVTVQPVAVADSVVHVFVAHPVAG